MAQLSAASSKNLKNLTIELDEIERETLEIILKEIIVNLPMDTGSEEEVYRSDIQVNRDHFKLFICGYEMRALRKLLDKVR